MNHQVLRSSQQEEGFQRRLFLDVHDWCVGPGKFILYSNKSTT
jgi:hypothetical protein